MPECNGCKKDREKAGKSARQLIRLPLEVTQDKDFQRKGLPVQLCEYCCPSDSPIWMADLGWQELGSLKVGDQIIGWKDDGNKDYKLCEVAVLNLTPRQEEVVEIRFESGRIAKSTPDHGWLTYNYNVNGPMYMAAAVGRDLRFVCDPWNKANCERTAGYLAGIYDGEGSGARAAYQCIEHNPRVHAKIGQALTELEIAHSVQGNDFTLIDGRWGYLDFFQKIRPEKSSWLRKHILTTRFSKRDRVVDIVPLGEQEVISMKTSSGNFVAWGYASKNCDGDALEEAIKAHQRRISQP